MFTIPKFSIRRYVKKIKKGYFHEIENSILYKLTPIVGKKLSADNLTFIGFLGSMWMGVWISLSGENRLYLFISLVGWLINWFGDGLDGKVAAFRKESRPRYGYYIDSMVDMFMVVLVMGSFHISTLTVTSIWLYVLLVSLMIAIHTFLKASVTRVFDLQVEQIGGLEIKTLAIFILVSAVFFGGWTFSVFGYVFKYVDAIGAFVLIVALYMYTTLFYETVLGKNRIKD